MFVPQPCRKGSQLPFDHSFLGNKEFYLKVCAFLLYGHLKAAVMEEHMGEAREACIDACTRQCSIIKDSIILVLCGISTCMMIASKISPPTKYGCFQQVVT